MSMAEADSEMVMKEVRMMTKMDMEMTEGMIMKDLIGIHQSLQVNTETQGDLDEVWDLGEVHHPLQEGLEEEDLEVEVEAVDLLLKMGLFLEEEVLVQIEVVLALVKDLASHQLAWDHQEAGVRLGGMGLTEAILKILI